MYLLAIEKLQKINDIQKGELKWKQEKDYSRWAGSWPG